MKFKSFFRKSKQRRVMDIQNTYTPAQELYSDGCRKNNDVQPPHVCTVPQIITRDGTWQSYGPTFLESRIYTLCDPQFKSALHKLYELVSARLCELKQVTIPERNLLELVAEMAHVNANKTLHPTSMAKIASIVKRESLHMHNVNRNQADLFDALFKCGFIHFQIFCFVKSFCAAEVKIIEDAEDLRVFGYEQLCTIERFLIRDSSGHFLESVSGFFMRQAVSLVFLEYNRCLAQSVCGGSVYQNVVHTRQINIKRAVSAPVSNSDQVVVQRHQLQYVQVRIESFMQKSFLFCFVLLL